MERKLIQEINLLENKKLVMNLNIVAIAIVLILTVLGIVFQVVLQLRMVLWGLFGCLVVMQ